MITKSAYADKNYVLNLAYEFLDLAYLETIRHQEAYRHSNIPVQKEEWPRDPGEQNMRHIPNTTPTTISDPVPRDSPLREFIYIYSVPREKATREMSSRYSAELLTQRRSVRQRRAPVKFNFDK